MDHPRAFAIYFAGGAYTCQPASLTASPEDPRLGELVGVFIDQRETSHEIETVLRVSSDLVRRVLFDTGSSRTTDAPEDGPCTDGHIVGDNGTCAQCGHNPYLGGGPADDDDYSPITRDSGASPDSAGINGRPVGTDPVPGGPSSGPPPSLSYVGVNQHPFDQDSALVGGCGICGYPRTHPIHQW